MQAVLVALLIGLMAASALVLAQTSDASTMALLTTFGAIWLRG